MIAAVRGEVMVRRSDHVVIAAGGVGYRLSVSAETLKSVPATGRDAFLHAELISRDDSLTLYGFASEEE
ncbi:MAG TPA: OB-fold domain-containing protein, partial [Solirubrobacterales bacterium]|nr:OB-fold domain-containing protein [Solirubrobacterales bacterium]